MTLRCGHCGREYPASEFNVRRRTNTVLPSGHPIRFGAYHSRCGYTTMMQHVTVPNGGKMAAEVKA